MKRREKKERKPAKDLWAGAGAGANRLKMLWCQGRGKTGELPWPVNCHIESFVARIAIKAIKC